MPSHCDCDCNYIPYKIREIELGTIKEGQETKGIYKILKRLEGDDEFYAKIRKVVEEIENEETQAKKAYSKKEITDKKKRLTSELEKLSEAEKEL